MIAAFSSSAFSTNAFSVGAFDFGSTPPPTETVIDGAGNENWLNVNAPRRKKKKRESTVIHYSDFDSQEAYAAALAAAAMPMAQVSDAPAVQGAEPDDDFEDDDAILFAIMRIYH